MILRALVGLILGLISGVVFGTIIFHVRNLFLPEPNDLGFGGSLSFQILAGFIFFGLPNAAVGAIIGGLKLNKFYSAAMGAVFALLLILIYNLNLLQKSQSIIFESEQVGWTPLKGASLLTQAALLLSFICASVIVSVIISNVFKQRTVPNPEAS